MAARTLTYTINMSATPKQVHVGVNTIPFDFNSGTSKLGTLSDVVLLGKVPNGALITGKNIRFGVNASTGPVNWQMQLLVTDSQGTFSVLTTLMNSMTSSATAAVFTDIIPYKLSLSDDRAVQYAVLALNCSTGATETVSVSFQGFVNYLMDGSSV